MVILTFSSMYLMQNWLFAIRYDTVRLVCLLIVYMYRWNQLVSSVIFLNLFVWCVSHFLLDNMCCMVISVFCDITFIGPQLRGLIVKILFWFQLTCLLGNLILLLGSFNDLWFLYVPLFIYIPIKSFWMNLC